jgi:hypothetical protein
MHLQQQQQQKQQQQQQKQQQPTASFATRFACAFLMRPRRAQG